MSDVPSDEQIVWTPDMPDRRKNDRRNNARDLQTTGKSLNISNMRNGSDRRKGPDRRKTVSVTITGRAVEVDQQNS